MTAFRESGTGPLLLCLHGIGGSAESFRPQLEGLGDRFHVVARDAPGYAHAADPTGYPETSGYVAEVVSLIARTGHRTAFLLGMSWGGVIAMEVALARPDLVDGLVLGDSTRGSGQSPRQAEAMLARVEELDAVGPRAYARQRTPRLFSRHAPRDLVDRAVEASAGAVRLAGFAPAARLMAETDLGPRLGRIGAPTLVIYGEDDVVTGAAESEALAAGIPGATLVRLPRAGHVANQEAPDAFNDEVARYLLALSAGSSSAG